MILTKKGLKKYQIAEQLPNVNIQRDRIKKMRLPNDFLGGITYVLLYGLVPFIEISVKTFNLLIFKFKIEALWIFQFIEKFAKIYFLQCLLA